MSARLGCCLALVTMSASAWADEPAAVEAVDVEAGDDVLDVEAEDPAIVDVVATPPATPPRPVRSGMSGDAARQTAGVEGDPSKVLGSLPGVSRAPLGSSDVIVWGAAGEDTLVLVEGIPVPSLYHFGGVRGVIPADAIGGISLVPGGFGPERGRASGGLVEVTLARPDREGLHGTLSANIIDASLTMSLAGDDAAGMAAARYGYLDRLVELVAPDASSLYVVPRYYDGVLSATADVGPGTVGAVAILSSDARERVAPSADPAEAERDRQERAFTRFGLPVSYLHDDGSETQALVFWGHDDERRDSRFGGQPLALSERAWLWGVRAEHTVVFPAPVRLRIGADVEARHASLARAGSLTLPAREGDRSVFGQEPAGDVATDGWRIDRAGLAPYAVVEGSFGPVKASLGARADFTLTTGDKGQVLAATLPPIGFANLEPTLDPRASVAVAVSDALELFASGGVYHQAAQPRDLSYVFGNPTLETSRAIVASAGQRASLADVLSVEVTGFYRALDELVARSRLTSPVRGRLLTQNGEGRAYGAQLHVRLRELHGVSGWVAYTLSRSERKIDVDPDYRLFDGDQPHVLSAVLGYAIAGWSFGARFRYTSGLPRTPVTGGFYDTTRDRFEPLFGGYDTARFGDFIQLDLHAEVKLDLAPVELAFFLDVQNVTFHQNPEELAFDYDYAGASPVTGLPTFGVLGTRLSI